MSFSKFNLEKLIQITKDILVKNKIFSLEKIKLSRKPENIWKQIALNYFENDSHTNAFCIYQWFQRNYQNFATFIEDITNSAENVDQKTKHEFIELKIDQSEILKLKSYIGNYNRSKFKKDFDVFLSKKLQILGIKCWLKCKYNWFSKSTCTKNPYWKGVFECIDPNCPNVFKASINKIFDQNDSIFLLNERNKTLSIRIQYTQNNIHKKFLTKNIKCSGKSREEQNTEILAYGLTNCQTNNVIFNTLNPASDKKITNKNTLKMIKSEFVNRHKMSSDVYIDTLATKTLTDGLCLESSSNIEGYIQEIGLNPFGFLLLSDIQVNFVFFIVLNNIYSDELAN